MCGLVAAVSYRNVVPHLIEGLQQLEYRGYDSAGVAALHDGQLLRKRTVGRVETLSQRLQQEPISSTIGIAHTRWATHGAPEEQNAHPQFSNDELAVVHNGIIENYDILRDELEDAGYVFESETDTEVVAHLLHQSRHRYPDLSLREAVYQLGVRLKGAYALAVLEKQSPDRLVLARRGSPLLIGVGEKEQFVASDTLALKGLTHAYIALEEGDVAEVEAHTVTVYNHRGELVVRELSKISDASEADGKGDYEYHMLKEIHEQDARLADSLSSVVKDFRINWKAFADIEQSMLERIEHLHLVACGTSYHAAMTAAYWIETLCGIPVKADLASEYRYRRVSVPDNTLFVSLSQSGETADTLAALRYAKTNHYLSTLTICNVVDSSLARESDFCLPTRAGAEVGVASTKAFTTQLAQLMVLAVAIARCDELSEERELNLLKTLSGVSDQIRQIWRLEPALKRLASQLSASNYIQFLGRGPMYPVAMEGALKLKEISYITAEAYAAGELKHGPLAMVDDSVPVIALAPPNRLLSKMKANMSEVAARGGRLIVLTDEITAATLPRDMQTIVMPDVSSMVAPILYTIPLQLLAYYVALERGNDVDKPRNLAKAVTVE